MQLSATKLGEQYGLTGEEMNRVLVKSGILTGEPGNYDVTLKGMPYTTTKNWHRGTGGYNCYNRYWDTRTFDDSIREVLDVTKDLVAEVRAEIEENKLLKAAARKAAREKANAEFLKQQAAKEAARIAAEKETLEMLKRKENWIKAGKIGIVVSGIMITGYGVYKAVPRIKKWWQGHEDKPDESKADHLEQEETK